MTDNFILLKPDWPDLYDYAIQAEKNAFHEPNISCVQMRCFVEILVGRLYRKLNLQQPKPDTLFSRLDTDEFKEYIPKAISSYFHSIRMLGNKAAHGKLVEQQAVINLLEDLHQISAWFYGIMTSNQSPWPAFQLIQPTAHAQPNTVDLQTNIDTLKRIQNTETITLAENNLKPQYNELSSNIIKEQLQNQIDTEISLQSKKHVTFADAFAEYDLTTGQKKLVQDLEQFFNTKEQHVFLLKGYAGTGKTFITKGLTEYFKSIGRNYVLLAPTGKAAKVIEQKTGSQASTIHKAVYAIKHIKQYKEDVDGTGTYKFYAELAANDDSVDTVYIIDEASMVSDIYQESEFFRFGSGHLLQDLLQYINLDQNDHHKKVIFIGDNAQLPPVGMNSSPALSELYLTTDYGVNVVGSELKEVVRQKSESGVIHHALMLREAMHQNVFNQLVINSDFSDVNTLYYDEFMPQYLATSHGKMSADTIVIAYSNTDVAAYNKRIREHFFPNVIDLQARDKIIVVNNYYDIGSGQMIANGEFGMIKTVYGAKELRRVIIKRKNENTQKVDEIPIELAFRNVELVFKDLKGKPYYIESKIIENLLDSDRADLSSDERKALYVDFCIRHSRFHPDSLEFKECLKNDPYFTALRIKYGYAITCHKAQGSEWKYVFVKCKIHNNVLTSAYFRWLYTAITRTSAQLYLIDPPHLPLGCGLKSVPPTYIPDHLRSEVSVAAKLVPISDENQAMAFDIPQSNIFLTSIFNQVQSLIHQSSFKIVEIKHHQYQEAYTFSSQDTSIRINIGYNSKQQVTYLRSNVVSAQSTILENILAALKRPGGVAMPIAVEKDLNFEQDFLQAFHQRLLELCHAKQIEVAKLTQKQWCQHYMFKKQENIAVFNIWYNSKKRFSSYQPELAQCTSMELVIEMNQLLMEDLNT